jgi:hypothetical protein
MTALLTPAEALAYLKIERKEPHRVLSRLGVPCVRLGHRTVRYRLVDLERFVQRRVV